jgi:hypothetical protein
MERVGKILVFVYTILAVSSSAWALALWGNRVDWTDRKATADKPAGLLAERRAEYERSATTSLRPADRRLRDNRVAVDYQEYWRASERNWYTRELDFLQNGDTEKRPVRQVARAADGLPVGVEDSRPNADLVQMRHPFEFKEREKPNDPESPLVTKVRKDRSGQKDLVLQTHDTYTRAIEDMLKKQDEAAKRVVVAAKNEKDFTEKLGIPGKPGLFAQVQDEHFKQALLEAEYDELRPLWLNAQVELQNLKELEQRLQERLQELEGKKAVTRAGRP